MKVGDLVKDVYTGTLGYQNRGRVGIIIKEVWDPRCGVTSSNKVFDILWQNGTIGHNVWNYDLESVDEKR